MADDGSNWFRGEDITSDNASSEDKESYRPWFEAREALDVDPDSSLPSNVLDDSDDDNSEEEEEEDVDHDDDFFVDKENKDGGVTSKEAAEEVGLRFRISSSSTTSISILVFLQEYLLYWRRSTNEYSYFLILVSNYNFSLDGLIRCISYVLNDILINELSLVNESLLKRKTMAVSLTTKCMTRKNNFLQPKILHLVNIAYIESSQRFINTRPKCWECSSSALE